MATIKDTTLTTSTITVFEGGNATIGKTDTDGHLMGYNGMHSVVDLNTGQTRLVTQADVANFSAQDWQDQMNYQMSNTYAPIAAAHINAMGGNWDNLDPQTQASLTSLAWNYGDKSCLNPTWAAAAQASANGPPDQNGLNSIADTVDKHSSDNGGINAARRASEANAIRTGQPIKSAHGGGPSSQISDRSKGKAPGTGASCAGAGMGIFGAIAAAGMALGAGFGISGALGAVMGALGQTGITGAMSAALGQAGNVLGGGLAGALGQVGGAINTLSGGVFQQLSQVGSGILPSLTGVLPSGLSGVLGGALNGAVGSIMGPLNGILQNPLNLPNAIQQFGANGGLNGMLNRVANNMVGGAAFGGTTALLQNMGISNAYGSIANNVVGAVAEGTGLRFGGGPGGIGANFLNNNGVISFGMSALSRNLPAAAQNFTNLGSFSTTNLLRLQQPSNVLNQIVAAGLGNTTGITAQLIKNNIPVAGIDNPLHDTKAQQILNSITDSAAIGAVSSKFNIGKPLTHLGQLTDYSYMCPDLVTTGPSKSFNDLGQHLISLGVTKASDFQTIGTAISKCDAGFDLNNISQMSTPMYPEAASQLYQTYGYGGGGLGEITMADFIGTAAGYVHNDTLPYIIKANNDLMNTTQGQTINGLVVQLQTLLQGGYHVAGSAADPSTGQPAQADSIVMNGMTFYTLDSAVQYMITQIENALTAIKGISDPNIVAAIAACEQAHAASCAQLLKENQNIQKFNMNLFGTYENNPITAYVFADGLPYYGQQNGYGQIGDYLERVASSDIYGDAIRAAMRQGRNAAALTDLGVNVERFKLPHSQYYRDPSSFYLAAYTGNLPSVPQNLIDQYIPQSPQETYIDNRNQMLIDAGYDPRTMLPAQADETYFDLTWSNTNVAVREDIGLAVVRQVIDSNMIVIGDKAYLVGLDRSQTLVATINDKGLILHNNDAFVAGMLAIINKTLYGNIGTTKFNTPFFTDQMVYGVLEMLAQVTPGNINGLANTLIGANVMSGLLAKFNTVFEQLIKVTDTSMDRNIIAPWGAAGPDGQTTTLIR